MIAVDTTVLVRVLTNDDPEQAKRAMKRMRADIVWIPTTVLLETEWVLRHAYGLPAGAIGQAFATLLGIPNVEVQSRSAVLRAHAWHQGGMDFADALHLALSDEVSTFVSFDRSLAKTAKRAGIKPNVTEP